MKTLFRLSMLAVLGLTLTQCERVVRQATFTANTPVYMSYEDLRSSVKNENERSLDQPGKIFVYNHYILINEFEKGIHIYNNADPRNPQHVAFINIPGNIDLAVKDNVLYADSYVDLVAIDISDPTNAREIGRTKNVLSYTLPSTMDLNYPVSSVDQSKGVVVAYEIDEVTETCEGGDCGSYYQSTWDAQTAGPAQNGPANRPVLFAGNATNARSTTTPINGSGIAGSMARFLLVEDHLYVISDHTRMKVFVLNGAAPSEVNTIKPLRDGGGRGIIETLYAFKNHLFIGSTNGMFAYNIDEPASPRFRSMHQHFTACDPVVANDDYAFVTLRGGNTCGGFQNLMQVLDIRDIMNPRVVATQNVSSPFGLALDNENEVLFVCDGDHGLNIYKSTDPESLQSLEPIKGIHAYDVIANRNVASVIGNLGLSQYMYDASGTMNFLSTIELGR